MPDSYQLRHYPGQKEHQTEVDVSNDPRERQRRANLEGGGKHQLVQVGEHPDGSPKFEMKWVGNGLTDEQKATICSEMAKHGRLSSSARAAGTTMNTIKKYIKKDAEFGLAMEEALESYRDKLVTHHQDLVFNGIQKKHYNAKGDLVAETRDYPIRLIEMELKKHDPGYRDKQEMSVEHKGGVVVAPQAATSVEDWESRFKPQMKDVTPESEDRD